MDDQHFQFPFWKSHLLVQACWGKNVRVPGVCELYSLGHEFSPFFAHLVEASSSLCTLLYGTTEVNKCYRYAFKI